MDTSSNAGDRFVTAATQRLRERLARGEAIDVRGHGKAGGGLILAIQAFGAAIAERGIGRAGLAAVLVSAQRSQRLRLYAVAMGHVEMTCEVTEPDIALLMNEATAEESISRKAPHRHLRCEHQRFARRDRGAIPPRWHGGHHFR